MFKGALQANQDVSVKRSVLYTSVNPVPPGRSLEKYNVLLSAAKNGANSLKSVVLTVVLNFTGFVYVPSGSFVLTNKSYRVHFFLSHIVKTIALPSIDK